MKEHKIVIIYVNQQERSSWLSYFEQRSPTAHAAPPISSGRKPVAFEKVTVALCACSKSLLCSVSNSKGERPLYATLGKLNLLKLAVKDSLGIIVQLGQYLCEHIMVID